jgi:hypothetical protein
MSFSAFENPIVDDVLLIGRKAPIGQEAMRRLISAIAPEEYEIVTLDHPTFEEESIKRALLKAIPREKLLPLLLGEGEGLATETAIVRVRVSFAANISREVEL